MKRIKKVMKVSLIVVALLGVTVMAADHLSSSAKYGKGDIQMKRVEQSPQYKNGKFRNAEAWKRKTAIAAERDIKVFIIWEYDIRQNSREAVIAACNNFIG